MSRLKIKTSLFNDYNDFLSFCQNNRRIGIKILEGIRRYTPLIFKTDIDDHFTILAGYKVIKDLSKLLNPRNTLEYKAWRKSVLARDNYKCRNCGSELNLHAHHIIRVVDSPKDATSLDNGLTLCKYCHTKEHS